MYKELKFALDGLFIFMLVISIIMFLIGFGIDINGTVLETLHKIDFVILGGYYAFFGHGLYNARNRLRYCQKHWILLGLLLIPFIPIARLAKMAEFERAAGISTNALWHLLDELELL